jgi:hypothetical protein
MSGSGSSEVGLLEGEGREKKGKGEEREGVPVEGRTRN